MSLSVRMYTEKKEQKVRKFSYFCNVEWIEREFIRLLEGHHLYVERPRGILAAVDGVVQVSTGVVRIPSGQCCGIVRG